MPLKNCTCNHRLVAILLMIISQITYSCNSYKHISYFKDVPDPLNTAVHMHAYEEPVILINDLLYVSLQTMDPAANNLLNPLAPAQSSVQSSNTAYLVDNDGYIELPVAGRILVKGHTISEARELIRSKASIYYRDPVINIRYANFNITVLGEVNKPGQFTMPNERVTVLDALGVAGDMTIYGRRDNVLVIREENGIKNFIRLNLNRSDIINSRYFYLKQNDVVYIDPTKSKGVSTDEVKNRRVLYTITILSSLLSVAIISLTRI